MTHSDATPTPPSPAPPREREGETAEQAWKEMELLIGAASLPPSAGSGETELVDVEGIEAVIATLEGGPTAADAKKPLALRITQAIGMLRWLAAHPAGPTRAEEGK